MIVLTLLVVTDVTVRGGVDGYVRDLIAALLAAGHQVALLLERSTTSALRDEIPGRFPELPQHLAALYHGRHGPEALRREAERILRELPPAGVHVVCGSPRSCLVLREAVVARNLPLVVTEQQVSEELLLSDSDMARVQATYRAARAVVFVSQGNRRTMAERVGLSGVEAMVIPNGVDVAGLEARVASAQAGRPRGLPARLVAAARYSREKGLDALVRAVAMLPPGMVERLDLYGDGPERRALRDLIKDLRLGERVMLHGWRQDIPEQLAGHDLFVLPSTSEGMPYALLEAMAVGLPVVATDVPGIVEALAGGEAGLLVRREGPEALAGGIRAALLDYPAALGRARRARERARRLYDVAIQMQRTAALWNPITPVRTPRAW